MTDDLKAAHAKLHAMVEEIHRLNAQGLLDGASMDTIFAVGEAMGVISKAKALLGRDIDTLGDS